MTAERVTTFKIFVGNVPEDATNDEVKKIFEEFGTVVECHIMPGLASKAFVHMEDDIEGQHAIDQLQGTELRGHVLRIEESKRNKQELPKVPTVKLLVRNVAPAIDARGLRNLFRRFGFVVEAVLQNGEGHIRLEAIGDIGSAIREMNGYVTDGQALSVEPAPASTEEEEEPSPKKEKPKYPPRTNGYKNGRERAWQSSNSYEDWNGYGGHNEGYAEDHSFYQGEPSPWDFHGPPMRQPFHPPTERILRDPLAARPRVPPNFAHRFPPPGNYGAPAPPTFMGPRGQRPGILPMRFRGHPLRGPPPPMRISRSGRAPPFGVTNPFESSFEEPMEEQHEEVFYEDEPIVAVPRDRSKLKPMVSGANTIPLGGADTVSLPRNPVQRGRGGGGLRRGGRGRGKPHKFTAVTHEVAPGEKYPVPPMINPSFRAPLKWPKEDRKKTGKRKKKPLVPAELPDYSLPVPELPKPTVPQGAVLKPFPPPASASSSSMQHENIQSINDSGSQIDFTSDDY